MDKAKSFYIFDFDDNIINTGSKTFIYHKETGAELELSTTDYVQYRHSIGKTGLYRDYHFDHTPMRSFRSFHDSPAHDHFPFIDDLKKATAKEGWEGPSWTRLLKAINRNR
ncbi:MAG: hypothetical protein AAF203_04455, partial [Pseudomonadota bacterium]